METCANCERTIGKLETPHLWRGKVVCEACSAMLATPRTPAPRPKANWMPTVAILLTVVGGIVAAVFLMGEPLRSHDENISLGGIGFVAGVIGFFWYAGLRMFGRA